MTTKQPGRPGTGVTRSRQKWMARIQVERVQLYLGVFPTRAEARRAVVQARQAMEAQGE